MASRPRTVSLVALLALLAACTDTAATPTAPPDVFAPTPSIQEPTPTTEPRPKPTTTLDVERAIIYPVDPVTLQALPGFEPMLMKDWVWGRPSPDGTYFAASVSDDLGSSEIRLIDVPNWEQVGSWLDVAESELLVTDEGRIHFLRSGNLRTVEPGLPESMVGAELPPNFWSWGASTLFHGDFVTFGNRSEGSVEEAMMIVVDPGTGEVTVIDLPEVRVGNLDPSNQEPWGGYLYASPAVVYDENDKRALIVHADRETITEVDLETGSAVEHELGSEDPDPSLGDTALLMRSGDLSPDGATLYVGTQRGKIVVTDDSWSYHQTPVGVIAVDTGTWEVTGRLDEPIGEVHLSPDGRTLLAWGYTGVEEANSYEGTSTGLYVLDAAALEVTAHHVPESTDQGYGPVSFNQAAEVGYVTTWGAGRPRVDAIDLASGEVIATEQGFEYLEMLGSIGVMSKVISG